MSGYYYLDNIDVTAPSGLQLIAACFPEGAPAFADYCRVVSDEGDTAPLVSGWDASPECEFDLGLAGILFNTCANVAASLNAYYFDEAIDIVADMIAEPGLINTCYEDVT